MGRRSRACLGTLLLTLVTFCASAASPKRILVLTPFGRDVEPFGAAVLDHPFDAELTLAPLISRQHRDDDVFGAGAHIRNR